MYIELSGHSTPLSILSRGYLRPADLRRMRLVSIADRQLAEFFDHALRLTNDDVHNRNVLVHEEIVDGGAQNCTVRGKFSARRVVFREVFAARIPVLPLVNTTSASSCEHREPHATPFNGRKNPISQKPLVTALREVIAKFEDRFEANINVPTDRKTGTPATYSTPWA